MALIGTRSILEENVSRISKKCVWMLTVGLIVAISVSSLFIGLEVLSSIKEGRLDRDYTTQQDNFTALSTQNQQLDKDLKIAQERNRNAIVKVETQRALNKSYTEKNKTISEELQTTTTQLQITTSRLIWCGIVGGLSLIVNVADGIYTLNLVSQLKAATALSAYIQPRYYLGILSALEHFLRLGENAEALSFKLLYNSSVKYSKEALKTSVNNAAKTVTLFITSDNEIIAFVMDIAWNFAEESQTDPKAFTFSYRRFNQTTQGEGPSVYPKSEFLTIGKSEIQLKEDRTAVAIAKRGFVPPEPSGNPNDFYVANGAFTLSTLLVYQFS